MSVVKYDWNNVATSGLCSLFMSLLVCFAVCAVFVQAEHVAEDPGWQMGDKKLHYWETAELLLFGIQSSKCLVEAGH